ncbi:uncharacterized protein Z520_09225 [Fonsecaea multimorphosa CBS 102226]|uniref:Major facilitator superfamily (MFS) profile domain-containing protein n=1 Tax=Fonsecaea multimorphosa CBS 102226 TaxID=1442371 RepID=A0A0D2GZI4_9EURO|nr:uncharacterized protein Z520_09225 [Fonsecaea multimorphosa CBS 102226]KIX94915.1 hypothetical protein Z520_09225 [Fonsecaea multimorphosa CBS 102226]OAL20567.1 hypothetical protein AYO22_08576 [Fonsecaea multimorphosa]
MHNATNAAAAVDSSVKSPIDVQDNAIVESQHSADKTDEVFVEDATPTINRKAERKLVRKQDMIILPLLGIGYMMGVLDRSNIGNARLMGIQKDLNLSNHQYFQVLMVTYIGFLVLQTPAALLMKILAPRWVLGGSIAMFGLVAALFSKARNFADLIGLRLLLGFGEAIVPLSFLYISMWYKHDELALRGCLIYWSTSVASFAGGLIAYGVEKNIHNAHGLRSWQWLFIVEGVPTFAVGLAIIIFLPPYPDKVVAKGHFLFSRSENELLLARTRASQNTAGAKVVPRQIWIAFKDPKTYLGSLMLSAVGLSAAAFAVFLPTFINAFGFDRLTSQLYTIIPYSFAVVSMPVACWLSDRYQQRGLAMAICLGSCLIGIIIILASPNPTVSMVGTCFVAAGTYPGNPIAVAWISTIHGGYTKRSTVYGIQQVFINSFIIMATQVFDTPPKFYKGNGILLGIFAVAFSSTAILYFWLRNENRKRDAAAEARRNGSAPPLPTDIGDFETLCDYHPDWRYPL